MQTEVQCACSALNHCNFYSHMKLSWLGSRPLHLNNLRTFYLVHHKSCDCRIWFTNGAVAADLLSLTSQIQPCGLWVNEKSKHMPLLLKSHVHKQSKIEELTDQNWKFYPVQWKLKLIQSPRLVFSATTYNWEKMTCNWHCILNRQICIIHSQYDF